MKRIILLLGLICMIAVVIPRTTAAASYTTSASASPATVSRGATVTITVVVKSAAAAKLLVDLEVYRPDGQRAYQQVWDNQSFTAGQQRTFSASWPVPAGAATGTYVSKVGLFSPGWGTLYSWNDAAGQFGVSSTVSSTATPTKAPATATPTAAAATPTKAPATATPTKLPATATPTKAPATAVPPTATPVSGQHFATLPPGSALPSDAACAAAVKRRPENKRANATFNATRGSQQLSSNFLSGDPRANTQIAARVTGNFTGTTDEILQWAACKWGIDEDTVRAQAAVESWWRQSTLGDWTTDASRCAPGHGLGADGQAGQCPESFGILQNRYPYEQSAWPGIGNSTAFNADTAYAIWRSCYEGYEWWLNDVERGQQYAAGDAWGCVGRWFAGRWHTQPAEDYITRVRGYLTDRIWEQPSFQEP